MPVRETAPAAIPLSPASCRRRRLLSGFLPAGPRPCNTGNAPVLRYLPSLQSAAAIKVRHHYHLASVLLWLSEQGRRVPQVIAPLTGAPGPVRCHRHRLLLAATGRSLRRSCRCRSCATRRGGCTATRRRACRRWWPLRAACRRSSSLARSSCRCTGSTRRRRCEGWQGSRAAAGLLWLDPASMYDSMEATERDRFGSGIRGHAFPAACYCQPQPQQLAREWVSKEAGRGSCGAAVFQCPAPFYGFGRGAALACPVLLGG